MRYLFIIALTAAHIAAVAQNTGINNIWMMGYYNGLGESKIDFFSGSPAISYYPIPMDFRHTHTNISDSSGNLLFYTNGVYIADATHDTMMNGSGINPGAYSNFVPDGHLIAQGALIIKKPGWGNEYYMIHNSADNYPNPFPPSNGSVAYYLLMTVIDMDLNGGLGGVTVKNHPLIVDTLNTGKIHAVKHANGRDWWVVCHRVNSNMYYKILVTPYGLPTFSTQSIGAQRMWDAGQAKFSPDGTKYAYYHYFDGLDIMDFDRCTGMFSNVVSDTTLPYIQGNVGCEFSPNSQLLYVTNILSTYQYDVTISNPIASRIEVAVWDTFYHPTIPFLGVYMCIPQLAPDGKIYITTGNGTDYLGRINNPNIPGAGCDVAQHSVTLPTYSFNTLPNHPNYFLSKIPGSPCDTVVDVGWEESPEVKVGVYPNPSNGVFTLSFPVQSESGVLEVYDVNGKLVFRENVAQWSQFKRVELSGLISGVYMCRMRWGVKEKSVRVVVNDGLR